MLRSHPCAEATFIVFDKQAMAEGGGGPPAGALDGSTAGMVGDVNLFLLPADEGEDYAAAAAEVATDVSAPAPAPAPASVRAAEIMIMVAEPAARRRGVAAEAARVMMEWGESAGKIVCG
jgi:RimJ/RimL family protein N-acetyltransferase